MRHVFARKEGRIGLLGDGFTSKLTISAVNFAT